MGKHALDSDSCPMRAWRAAAHCSLLTVQLRHGLRSAPSVDRIGALDRRELVFLVVWVVWVAFEREAAKTRHCSPSQIRRKLGQAGALEVGELSRLFD